MDTLVNQTALPISMFTHLLGSKLALSPFRWYGAPGCLTLSCA